MTDPIQTQSDARRKAREAWDRFQQWLDWNNPTVNHLKDAVRDEITAHLEASTKDPKSPLGHLYAMRDEDLQGQADMEERVARLEGREGDTGVAGAMAHLVRRAEHQATVIADLRKQLTEMQGWHVAEILKAAKGEPPAEETVDLRHRDYTVAAKDEREGNRLDHFERRLAVWHERLLAVEDHLRENGGFPPIDGEPSTSGEDPWEITEEDVDAAITWDDERDWPDSDEAERKGFRVAMEWVRDRLRSRLQPTRPEGESERPFRTDRPAAAWLHRALNLHSGIIMSVEQCQTLLEAANRASEERPTWGQPGEPGGLSRSEPEPAPQDSPGPERRRCKYLKPGQDVCLRHNLSCEAPDCKVPVNEPSPGPELPHEGPCYGFGPGDTCAQCHDADGPELPEAVGYTSELFAEGKRQLDAVDRVRGQVQYVPLYSEATVRSLVERAEKAEREREEFRAAYEREHESHTADADWCNKRIRELEADVEDLEGQVSQREKYIETQRAKLAQRPEITWDEIRAAKAAAGQSIWRPDVASALRTLADKLQRIRDSAPAHDCTEHVRIEVTEAAVDRAAREKHHIYVMERTAGPDPTPWEESSDLHRTDNLRTARRMLTAAIPHLKLVPKEEAL